MAGELTQEILQAVCEGDWKQNGNTWVNRTEQAWWTVEDHEGWAIIYMNAGSVRFDSECYVYADLPRLARALEKAATLFVDTVRSEAMPW